MVWNDTDTPLAYFITFRTYGTWLHGDERGSTSRHHNIYKTPKLRQEPDWRETNRKRMLREAVILNASQRAVVEEAIRNCCRLREWALFAINIRTNHGHTVIHAPQTPIVGVLNALKSNATRMMRERSVWNDKRSPWSDKGSTRFLWNEESVLRACHYVEHGQGDELIDFD